MRSTATLWRTIPLIERLLAHSRRRWRNLGELQSDPDCNNGIDDDGNGFIDDCWGYNFAENSGGSNLMGSDWHGTHVAGIVAADTDNRRGVSGTAWKASLMTLTCFGTSRSGGFEQSIVYAADNGAAISQK